MVHAPRWSLLGTAQGGDVLCMACWTRFGKATNVTPMASDDGNSANLSLGDHSDIGLSVSHEPFNETNITRSPRIAVDIFDFDAELEAILEEVPQDMLNNMLVDNHANVSSAPPPSRLASASNFNTLILNCVSNLRMRKIAD